MGVSSVGANANIHNAIAVASRKTGIDFNYLLGQAQVESGFRANARAATSSASGLYQFIEQSWLGVVKEHGAEHGMGWASDSIRQTAAGRYVVSDPAARRAILELRNNPEAAALMAAEHASDNKSALESSLGREANGTDLYMAHFLGVGGARNFLGAMDRNPDRAGAAMFPSAARANRNIFYASNGQPRTLGQIYERFAGKLDKGAAAVGATGLASAGGGLDWAKALGEDGDVILGTEAAGGDRGWINTTLANLNTLTEKDGRPSSWRRTDLASLDAIDRVNPLRPTPETAKLAYMMLASLGA
jgi:hypothetical protein